MPNSASCAAYLFAIGSSSAREFVMCGVMSGNSTSAITSTLSPPRTGSGHENTGRSTQSEFEPGAWFVLEPSNPQIGRSSAFGRTFVLDRRRAVGSVPSIQMYSALITAAPLSSLSSGRDGVRLSRASLLGGSYSVVARV
jgi:hypothetical protein